MKRVRVFLLNGIVLTITSFLMSGIGVWFSLYLTNKIGAEMMGVYQLIMSVYSFGVTLATSGINLAATRQIAEALGKNSRAGLRHILVKCLLYSLFFGMLACVILLLFGEQIGLSWLKNEQTILPLKIMAVSFPFIAMSSVLSGYFTAVRRVYKNASVQILEQFFKIFLTIWLLTLLMPRGLEYACVAIALSGTISEGISFLSAWLLYLFDRRRYTGAPVRGTGRQMLGIALPVALSSYLRSGLMTLKNLLVPIQLQKYGMSAKEAVSAFGIVHGIVLPVILFPSSFLFSFTGLVIPELAEAHSKNAQIERNVRIQYIINRMIQVTLLFSIGVAGILFVFSAPVAGAVSGQAGVSGYIRLLAPIIPVMYLDNTVDNMLKGLNEQVSSMRYNIIDAFLCVIFVFSLLPVFGLKGYLFIICFSEVLNFALSFNRLVTVSAFRLDLKNGVVKPLVCIAGASLLAMWLLRAPFAGQLSPAMQTTFVAATTLLLYCLFLRLTGCFSSEDTAWLKNIIFKR